MAAVAIGHVDEFYPHRVVGTAAGAASSSHYHGSGGEFAFIPALWQIDLQFYRRADGQWKVRMQAGTAKGYIRDSNRTSRPVSVQEQAVLPYGETIREPAFDHGAPIGKEGRMLARVLEQLT